MKSILTIRAIVGTLSIFSIIGCGGGSTSGDATTSTGTTVDTTTSLSPTVEVAGPGGAFKGATEFTTEMIAGQSIYEWNDDNDDGIATKDEWLRATFESNGALLFERDGMSEITGSYIVVDGKIMVSDQDGDSEILLNVARATQWDVSFEGSSESGTWFLELKYNATMLVGKKFSFEFGDGIAIGEYGITTAKAYDTNGNLLDEIEYTIKDGVLIHRPAEDADERYLMKIEADGSLLAWHPVESEADLFTSVK